MLSFRDASIKRKLLASIMVTCLVALVLSSAVFMAFQIIYYKRSTIKGLATLAEMIGTNSTAAIVFNDPSSAEQTLAALKAEPTITEATGILSVSESWVSTDDTRGMDFTDKQ